MLKEYITQSLYKYGFELSTLDVSEGTFEVKVVAQSLIDGQVYGISGQLGDLHSLLGVFGRTTAQISERHIQNREEN